MEPPFPEQLQDSSVIRAGTNERVFFRRSRVDTSRFSRRIPAGESCLGRGDMRSAIGAGKASGPRSPKNTKDVVLGRRSSNRCLLIDRLGGKEARPWEGHEEPVFEGNLRLVRSLVRELMSP